MSEAKRYWADIGMSQDDQADNPNENVFTLMVKAEDYDALRAEVERLNAVVLIETDRVQAAWKAQWAAEAEIERLRAALTKIEAYDPGRFRPLVDEIAIWEIAHDALRATGQQPGGQS